MEATLKNVMDAGMYNFEIEELESADIPCDACAIFGTLIQICQMYGWWC